MWAVHNARNSVTLIIYIITDTVIHLTTNHSQQQPYLTHKQQMCNPFSNAHVGRINVCSLCTRAEISKCQN